ncbi:MAG: tRNA (N(6)-L-threonylcarbamoyladenosine(37)-C(2))-methylthiotransferase MtaB [Magnetococcales bacterium]|nr:tRNA (N(6)-L-threonylcarbamoyladenosine(37)-C(2))-methylthiotransferase MtaB [Magnetococcales bacterium]
MKIAGHAISPARYFTVLTMGCRVNQVETERLSQTGAAYGFYPVPPGGTPDIVIINTCSVTSESDRQARQQIRRVGRENPQAQLVITGCYAQGNAARLEQMPGVALVVGNREKEDLWEHLTRLSTTHHTRCVGSVTDRAAWDAVALVDTFADHSRAFLQVQDGCDNRCTFCTIPGLRGPSRSLSVEYVRAQAARYRATGYQEIVLTGINLGTYGKDRTPPGTLAQLVASLVPDMTGRRLRLSSVDPQDVQEDLIQQFAEPTVLCPYLHLSIQAGDDLILKRMGRDYGRHWILEQIRRLRAVRPEMVFGADLIVGFPTETAAAFQQTLDLVEEAEISFLHVFRYSDRPGTPAAAIPGRFRVPPQEAQHRSELLRQKGRELLARTAQRWIGREETILVESLEAGLAKGKTAGFLPVCFPASPETQTGQLVTVRLTGFDPEQQTLRG